MASAKKLPSGSWRVNLYVGKVDGKREYKSFTAPTKKEAEYEAAEYNLTRKEKAQPMNMTVGEAIERYIDSKTNVLSPSTITAYRKIRKNNLQALMAIKLGALTQEAIQAAVNVEAATHSPKTIRNQHGLLSSALAAYCPDLRLSTKLPQRVRPDIAIPDQEAINGLIRETQGAPMELPIVLAACLGLRRSEICALLWTDYDAKKKTLSINKALVADEFGQWITKAPKSFAGKRTVTIPASVAQILDITPRTSPQMVDVTPAQITDSFGRLRRKSGVDCRFHDLRHYYASVMLALGVPDKYAMERMGHATPNMLKSVYQHTMQDAQKEIAKTLDNYFNAAMQHDKQHEGEIPQ